MKRAFEFGTAGIGADEASKYQQGSYEQERVQPAHQAHLVSAILAG